MVLQGYLGANLNTLIKTEHMHRAKRSLGKQTLQRAPPKTICEVSFCHSSKSLGMQIQVREDFPTILVFI